jgi:hypothetical protein
MYYSVLTGCMAGLVNSRMGREWAKNSPAGRPDRRCARPSSTGPLLRPEMELRPRVGWVCEEGLPVIEARPRPVSRSGIHFISRPIETVNDRGRARALCNDTVAATRGRSDPAGSCGTSSGIRMMQLVVSSLVIRNTQSQHWWWSGDGKISNP